MIELLVLAQLQFFHVTGPDGQPVEVNPEHVVILRPPRGSDHFSPGINCLVFTTDGKYIGTIEPCSSVQQILKGQQPTTPIPVPQQREREREK